MNAGSPWLIFAVLAILAVGAFVWYQWFRVFNSPDGQRYQKLVAQGPFAAASDEAVKPKGQATGLPDEVPLDPARAAQRADERQHVYPTPQEVAARKALS